MLQAAENSWYEGIVFQLSLAAFAFLSWFWSRTALNYAVNARDAAPRDQALAALTGGLRIYFKCVPRILFLAVAGAGLAIALRSEANRHAAVTVAWALAGSVFLLFRKRPNAISSAGEWRLCRDRFPDIAMAAPFGWAWVARVIIVIGVVAFLVSAFETSFAPGFHYADWVAGVFPGPSAAIISLAFILGPITWLMMVADGPLAFRWGSRRYAVPVMVALGGLIIWSFNVTVHPVRFAEGPLVQRVPLRDALLAWVERCGGDRPETVRPVVVALSGGASRAGLWATRVLEAVDAAAPDQGAGIFAVSSVSGGSLGAADYFVRRADASKESPCHLHASAEAGQKAASPSPDEKLVKERFDRDLLGPLLANAILIDPVRALLAGPVSLVWPNWPPPDTDRAAGLERAFERAWSGSASNRQHSLSSRFLDLFYDGSAWRPGMPIWISNGTEVRGGERLVTLPVAPDRERLLATWPFEGAKDVLSLLQADVAVSTAVHNSARFPFLSPTGTLVPQGERANAGGSTIEAPGLRGAIKEASNPPASTAQARNRADIADGGYFENSGVTTSVELITWLRNYGAELIGRKGSLTIDPILVVADADAEPSMRSAQVPRCGSGPDRDPAKTRVSKPASQIIAPLVALYSVRSGHAEYAIEKAVEAFCNAHDGKGVEPLLTSERPPPSMFNFYLHAPPTTPIPLNWVLSSQVIELIWNGLQDEDNAKELACLRSRVRGDGDWRQACPFTPREAPPRPVITQREPRPADTTEALGQAGARQDRLERPAAPSLPVARDLRQAVNP